MAHTLPQLPYALNALEPHIDARTMEIHHGKHHAAYVENLNKALADHPQLQAWSIEDLVSRLSEVPEGIRAVVRNNGGGHLNHSWFWGWMSPAGGGDPTGKLAEALVSTFGSIDQFREQFAKAGLGRFGSGWAWLVWQDSKLSITSTPNQDNPLTDGAIPLLGCDVWEHAYYLHYQNRRADYLNAWWNVVHWQAVADRFASV